MRGDGLAMVEFDLDVRSDQLVIYNYKFLKDIIYFIFVKGPNLKGTIK